MPRKYLIILASVLMLALVVGSYFYGVRHTRCQAVDAGAGAYRNTDSYGGTEFVWTGPKQVASK